VLVEEVAGPDRKRRFFQTAAKHVFKRGSLGELDFGGPFSRKGTDGDSWRCFGLATETMKLEQKV